MREDALEEVRRLKSGEGSELEVSGQGLAAALIQARRVDEIGVYIISMAVGGGKHFATLERPLGLGFPGLQTFEGCVVHLRYAMQAQPRALGHVHWGALDSYRIKACHPGQLPRKRDYAGMTLFWVTIHFGRNAL